MGESGKDAVRVGFDSEPFARYCQEGGFRRSGAESQMGTIRLRITNDDETQDDVPVGGGGIDLGGWVRARPGMATTSGKAVCGKSFPLSRHGQGRPFGH